VVPVEPEFAMMTDHMEPSVDLTISYPVMTVPPLSLGTFQERLICDDDTAVADKLVGGDGEALKVVADAVFDGLLVPAALTADTR